jgi:hypothetical protein
MMKYMNYLKMMFIRVTNGYTLDETMRFTGSLPKSPGVHNRFAESDRNVMQRAKKPSS